MTTLAADSALCGHFFSSNHEDALFLFVTHQISTDGVSLSILLEELWQSYATLREGRTMMLPEVELSWNDYIHWQPQMLEGEAGERLWNYWKTKLVSPLPILELPIDYSRPEVNHHRGGVVLFDSEGETQLFGSLSYNIDLFKELTVMSMVERFQWILGQVIAAPKWRIADFANGGEHT